MSKPFLEARYSYAREQWRRDFRKYCEHGRAVWYGLLTEEMELRHKNKPSYLTDKEYLKELRNFYIDYGQWIDPYQYEEDWNPNPRKRDV